MLFQYHSETDMLYVKLVDSPSVESEEVAPGIVIDFDENGRAIGIEIEDAAKFIDMSRVEILALPVAKLILSEEAPAATPSGR